MTNAEKDFDQLQVRSSFYTLILLPLFPCSILFNNKILATLTKVFQDLTEFGIMICLDLPVFSFILHTAIPKNSVILQPHSAALVIQL